MEAVTKQTREFQAETKQLLDLMVHSIYTNREIFLRELISNASDAIDKVRFAALTSPDLLEGDSELEIFLTPDEANKTLTITDNGMGMSYEEVVENIGTIAKSGTKAFLAKMQEADAASDSNLIGQFGVGFYSAFMVAEKVTLLTRGAGQAQGVRWESTGDGTYSVEPTEKTERGTTIILALKDEFTTGEENFLDRYKLQSLVKKYSDYIRYPIKMEFVREEKPRDDEGKEIEDAKAETVIEVKVLNSQTPLWTRAKQDITKDEYNQLYQSLFYDWQEPLTVLHNKAEGVVEYTSLLYIPAKAPFDFYMKEFEPGVRLYSKNVFIMEHCKELLPDYLRFVRGLVDSPDFSLNISRELLQHSQQLKLIGKNLEKTVLKALESMLTKERSKYETFWQEFGQALKAGVYSDFNSREKLQDLLLFSSSAHETGWVTLAEYVEAMPDNQTVIYYAAGKDRAAVERLPQLELLREKNLTVLYLFDRVDEFAIDALREYKGKKFQSVSRGDLQLEDLQAPEAKQQVESLEKDNADLLKSIKEQLGDKVADVKISNRLKSSAVCLVSGEDGISLAMEQVLAEMNNSMFKAKRILEINPQHELFSVLQQLHQADASAEQFKDYCNLLYDQALLIEGITPPDPVEFANKVARLMAKGN